MAPKPYRLPARPSVAVPTVPGPNEAAPAGCYWRRGPVPEHLPPGEVCYSAGVIEAGRGEALLALPSIGRLLVRATDLTVVDVAGGATAKDVECTLRGPVAALRRVLQGRWSLRGSAVDINGKALVVCGSAIGASTLVAALARRGHRTIADGVVAVDEVAVDEVVAQDGVLNGAKDAERPSAPRQLVASAVPEAAPPRVTLWPDAAAVLGYQPDEGEVVRSCLRSRSYTVDSSTGDRLGGATGGVPTAALAIVTVDNRLGPSGHLAATRTVALQSRAAAISECQWHAGLVAPLGLQAAHFAWLSALMEVPTVFLDRAPDPLAATLEEVAGLAESLLE